MKRVFIRAKTQQEAAFCAKQHDLKMGARTYLDRAEKLMGIKNPKIINYGDYMLMKPQEEAVAIAHEVGLRFR